MTKRCIAIEYAKDYCRIVQARRSNDGVQIEKALKLNLPTETDIRSMLHENGFNTKLPVTTTVSPGKCHFMNINSDRDLSNLEDDTSEISPAVKNENAIQIHLPQVHKLAGNAPSSIVISVEKDAVNEITTKCIENNLKCERIEIPLFALIAAIQPKISNNSNGAILLHVSNDRISIIIMADEDILLVRNIPVKDLKEDITALVCREVQLTWRTAYSMQIPEDIVVYCLNSHSEYQELESGMKNILNCQILTVSHEAEINFDSGIEDSEQYAIAGAIAQIYFRPNEYSSVNLLKTLNDEKDNSSLNSPVKYTAGLILLLMVMLIANLQIKNHKLNNIESSLNNEIETLFHKAVPGQETKNLVPKMMLSIMGENDKSITESYQLLSQYEFDKSNIVEIIGKISQLKSNSLKIHEIQIRNSLIKLTIGSDKNGINIFRNDLNNIPELDNIQIKELDNNMAIATMKIVGH